MAANPFYIKKKKPNHIIEALNPYQSSSSILTVQISPSMEDAISSTTQTSIVSSSDDDQKAKIADTDVEEEEDDKISSLPDAILCSIISEFSTKETVRTSILSKRWRYVWTSVPNLVLNDSEFLHDKERKAVDIKNSFANFMNRVLHHHNVSCIQKFHLSCRRNYAWSSGNALINTAIRRNVEEIDVNIYECVELSPSFFNCEKLAVLKLESIYFRNVPKSVHFPNLKIVHLTYVEFSDDDSVKNFLSGCQVLEELHIIECANVNNLCIQSSTLKKLTVRLESLDYYDEKHSEYRLVIEPPNLQYLHLTNCGFEDYTVNFLPSLVEVHLSVTLEDGYVSKDRFIKLLENIPNTKHLEVVRVAIGSARLPEFCNLPVLLNMTCLNVVLSDYGWDVFPFLLQLSPNLRTCFIDKDDPCGCLWVSPSCIPECLLVCLEEIVVKSFGALHYEIKMITRGHSRWRFLTLVIPHPSECLQIPIAGKLRSRRLCPGQTELRGLDLKTRNENLND